MPFQNGPLNLRGRTGNQGSSSESEEDAKDKFYKRNHQSSNKQTTDNNFLKDLNLLDKNKRFSEK